MMTREEAIDILENEKMCVNNETCQREECATCSLVMDKDKILTALDMALSALRPVSREQVEKGRWIFRPYEKMPWCTQAICSECGSVVENNSSLSQESGIKLFVESNPFCPNCGAPMTGEAVDIIMRRLETLYETT